MEFTWLLSLVIVLLLVSRAECCGMTVHSEIALRARTLFQSDVRGISDLVARYPHALSAGAPFPDYLYACGTDHDAGEDAHWHGFHTKAAAYIREKYPNWRDGDEHGAQLVVFMLGALSHYASDANWHGQRVKLDNKTRNFGLGFLEFLGEIDFGCHGSLCSAAHSAGDTGGEFVLHHQLNNTFNIKPLSWFVPVDDLVEIFHREPKAHPKVTATWIRECAVLFATAVEGVAAAGEAAFVPYVKKAPFLQEHIQEFWIGGVDDMVHFSLLAMNNFVTWITDGPPPVPPPVTAPTTEAIRQIAYMKRQSLKRLLNEVGNSSSQPAVSQLAYGAVHVSTQGGKLGPLEEKPWAPPGSYAYEGSAVLSCDMDGDGVAETVTALPGWSRRGAPLIGSVQVQGTKGTTILFPQGMVAGSRFGHAIACADFDRDGHVDLAVSSPTHGQFDDKFERQFYSGRVEVFFGSATGLGAQSGWSAEASGPADLFGTRLLALEGGKLAVGSPYWGRSDDQQIRPGHVHIFSPVQGVQVHAQNAEEVIVGHQPGELFGSSLCTQNGTLFVGAPGYHQQDATSASGAMYAVRRSEVVGHLWATQPHARFGHDCVPLGTGQLAISMPGADTSAIFGIPQIYSGAVILLGPDRLHSRSALTAQDVKTGLMLPKVDLFSSALARFGWSVATDRTGNLLAVGAPFGDSERGAVLAFKAPQWNLVGAWTGIGKERLGWAVAVSRSNILAGAPKFGKWFQGSIRSFPVTNITTLFI